MSEQIIVRDACRADLMAIVKMLANDSLGVTREQVTDPLPGRYVEAFERIRDDPNNHLMVAVCDRVLVGCLQLTIIVNLSLIGTTRAQIEGVRVHHDWRGRQIGHILVSWAIEEARALGCGMVQLTTDKRRTDAHRFYEGLGFVASHEGMKLKL